VTPESYPHDPDFGDTDIQGGAKKQAALLQHFWRGEYLTGLREFHQTTGSNAQTVKPGAAVLIHDDTPCITWHLVVIEDAIVEEDGLIRAANIRTSTERTNHPIMKLYPLELTAMDPSPTHNLSPEHNTQDSYPQDSVAHYSQ